jgi:asparagine synthase (glutamine-hydrolysing)
MCGIAGFFQSHPELDRAGLQRMTDIQAHRGPDADGHFFDTVCGLGHRRLSILDLSESANQPFWSADGSAVMVYNGEVYNYQEVGAALNMPFRTTSDTEVILEAYLRWGPEFVHRLNGMFAIAIYEPAKKRLFMCRDRMGIKPIYYYHRQGVMAFASELKGILALRPRLAFSVNPEAVRDYLSLGYVPEPMTICSEVAKFPAGCYAIFEGSEMHLQSYWQPEDKITSEVLRDEVAATDTLHDLIRSSVQYRMISDVPFGTFLSGGIDSSVVTAMAQSINGSPVNSFSIGFKEAKYNESHHAAAVAKKLGTHHHEFIVSEQDALNLVDRMIGAYDEPFADSSAIPTMLVSQLARKHVTMTLSGDGGDELFLGYGSYQWARRLSNPIIRALRHPIGLALAAHPDNRFKRVSRLFHYHSNDRIKSHIFSQEIYYFSDKEARNLLQPGFPSGLSFDEMHRPGRIARKLNPLEAQALFDIRYYLRDDLLAKVDRATMQFSLETRVPLLDYRIVEFALNLSPDLKIRQKTTKYLLKKVLYRYVPETLFDRPKWGFSIPLDRWLQKELHFLIDRYASKDACEKHGIIRYEVLKEYIDAFGKGRTFLYNRLWQVIVLHQLLDHTGLGLKADRRLIK